MTRILPDEHGAGFSTRAIHAGQRPDPTTGAIMPPIFQTSTYAQESLGVNKGYEYARGKNPTRECLERNIAALEGAQHGFAFSSVLTEMALPRARLASALFGFNLGVELGQLAVLALAWPVFRLLMRTRLRRHTLDLASAGALAAGVYWAVTRVALL